MEGETNRDVSGNVGGFPPTRWSKMLKAKAGNEEEQRTALNCLMEQYWMPVYCYVRRLGHAEEPAKDIVQSFFVMSFQKGLFGRADPAKGRFRNLLLKTLENFVRNTHRRDHAQKRHPKEGLVSIDQLATHERFSFEPTETETPDDMFHRAWVKALLLRVLHRLESEFRATGKEKHLELFRHRIIRPALDGAAPPALREMAERLELDEKEAANYLLTARRAYQRLLRQEIRLYASSDSEVSEEVHDLFRFLSGS